MEYTISKPGQHHTLRDDDAPELLLDSDMENSVNDFLAEPPQRFSSTMMMMDAPL